MVKSPGEAVGTGLLAVPASELGLLESTPVAVSLIDAHAGGVGGLQRLFTTCSHTCTCMLYIYM